MMAVTADARRRPGISLRDSLAMNTGLVLRFLVDTESRIVPFHECGIAVALSTKRCNRCRLRLSDKVLFRIHGELLVGLGRVATVTIHTRKPAASMNITLYCLHGGGKFWIL